MLSAFTLLLVCAAQSSPRSGKNDILCLVDSPKKPSKGILMVYASSKSDVNDESIRDLMSGPYREINLEKSKKVLEWSTQNNYELKISYFGNINSDFKSPRSLKTSETLGGYTLYGAKSSSDGNVLTISVGYDGTFRVGTADSMDDIQKCFSVPPQMDPAILSKIPSHPTVPWECGIESVKRSPAFIRALDCTGSIGPLQTVRCATTYYLTSAHDVGLQRKFTSAELKECVEIHQGTDSALSAQLCDCDAPTH